MEHWVKKVAVVTGAASGIGAATTKALAENGMQVVGLDTNDVKIKENAKTVNGLIYAIKCDITDEINVVYAFDWIKKFFGGVDVLVNCADITHMSCSVNIPTTNRASILTQNLIGLRHCTREALKTMGKRGDNGHIININGTMSHAEFEDSNRVSGICPANKFTLSALTETLRQDLKGLQSNIKVTSISPGGSDADLTRPSDGQLSEMGPPLRLDPSDVSEAVLYAMGTRPHAQVDELILQPTVLVYDRNIKKYIHIKYLQ